MRYYCIGLLLSFYFFILEFNCIFANSLGRAVVPSVVINVGEVLNESKLKELDVTNPHIIGGYARSIKDVIGLVTRRLLLPDRVIPLSVLHRPYIITIGSKVRIIFTQGNMTISAAGIALSDASAGDIISVKNSDTGVIISGNVMSDGTVSVTTK
ncbi:MAG: flagella basal body P-ring formation protein FlgA [Candidatus Liberibacter europaeus]|uniref:Flagella basal body P-ring formation protein FlgA n=1 Tax=Candidatus Liberibacter europaeus TaxID=744859 RepID=A0A2T4VYH7_9HYPH|nr:flagella basal body P-ring formation protein FlgA [Candidatus Liberibacter europaeus]PTL86832.1 MAG: flagella basal body P-ring formation protein FlgA [Candidatus Liberibacter europaeus]